MKKYGVHFQPIFLIFFLFTLSSKLQDVLIHEWINILEIKVLKDSQSISQNLKKWLCFHL